MATSYFAAMLDMNAAMRRALQVRYSSNSVDLTYLLQRYLRENADYNENMRKLLVLIANGQNAETASTSGGPITT